MTPEIRKYPRTTHVRGSRLQRGDGDMAAVPWSELAGKHLVVEEKVDGANCGISFTSQGELLLQSRGHFLHGGPREKQFELLKQWSACHQHEFFQALGSRYVMYGEWLFAKHTCFYDALPHYFMEFDVLDTETGDFLSTPARQRLLAPCPIVSVRVLHEGTVASVKELAKLIGRSAFISDGRICNFLAAAEKAGTVQASALGHDKALQIQVAIATGDWDSDMEGLYIKVEEDDRVVARHKYVRSSFTSSIAGQEEHWHSRPIVQNGLFPGAMEAMFCE